MEQDLSQIKTEDLWAALMAATEAITAIESVLAAAMELPDTPKLSPAEAAEFRAKHWQSLWDGSLQALRICEQNPLEVKKLLGI